MADPAQFEQFANALKLIHQAPTGVRSDILQHCIDTAGADKGHAALLYDTLLRIWYPLPVEPMTIARNGLNVVPQKLFDGLQQRRKWTAGTWKLALTTIDTRINLKWHIVTPDNLQRLDGPSILDTDIVVVLPTVPVGKKLRVNAKKILYIGPFVHNETKAENWFLKSYDTQEGVLRTEFEIGNQNSIYLHWAESSTAESGNANEADANISISPRDYLLLPSSERRELMDYVNLRTLRSYNLRQSGRPSALHDYSNTGPLAFDQLLRVLHCNQSEWSRDPVEIRRRIGKHVLDQIQQAHEAEMDEAEVRELLMMLDHDQIERSRRELPSEPSSFDSAERPLKRKK